MKFCKVRKVLLKLKYKVLNWHMVKYIKYFAVFVSPNENIEYVWGSSYNIVCTQKFYSRHKLGTNEQASIE
jgi:hypothetical protein